MMKRVWLFFLFIFLVSCGPHNFMYKIEGPTGQPVKVASIYFQDKWDEKDIAALNDAVKEWNYALDGKILLIVENEHYHYTRSSPNNKLIFIKIDSAWARSDKEYTALAWTRGRGSGVGGNRIYFVRDRILGDNLKYVALHEIGHALGSDHIEYEGLMNPYFDRNDYSCIDRTALTAVAKYQHISMDGLKWCRY